jgi:hypothetical protein
MFQRNYLVKIYLGGQSYPLVEYHVAAINVAVFQNSLIIDGVKLDYGSMHYIAVEKIDN